MDTFKSLQELAQSSTASSAVNNHFYDHWLGRSLNIFQLQLFARNYGEWVRSFPDTLAMLFYTTADIDAKIELVKTLYSEMGYGHIEKVHWRLLDTFFESLATHLNEPGQLSRALLMRDISPLKETTALIEGERNLYTDRNIQVALGAQLALEWQAYTMLRKLYEGARNYMSYWKDEDNFHEACEYFYAHIGAAEKEHKEESLKAALRYVNDDISYGYLKKGFEVHLKLIATFWEGIANAIATGENNQIKPTLTHGSF